MASADAPQDRKRRYREWLSEFANADITARRRLLSRVVRDDVAWHVCKPIETCEGGDAVYERFFQPLFDAFPDVDRHDDIMIAGDFGGRTWVASMGHYVGSFESAWLGIAPTGRVTTIRFGEFVRFVDDAIAESYVLLDVLDVLRQAGRWPLPQSLGAADRVPGPMTHDGMATGPADPRATDQSLRLVEAMIGGLMEDHGARLESMRMERFWHPRMMWYGPAGIGTTRGLRGFQRDHQGPFLHAFPDRRGGNHKARIADATYVASTGWPSVQATHLGDGWIGVPATGRRIGMRVMDFWRREGDLLRENWVFIDLVDLLDQMGVDVLARAGIAPRDA